MKINLRFFSVYRDITGARQTTIDVPERTTLEDLFQALLEHHPRLRSLRKSALFAVNREFAGSDLVLKEGDEVAFMPPVGGG